MLKRKIESYLDVWLQSKYALLVDGARQVGKTYILRQFAEKHFEHVVYLNLVENTSAVEILSQAKNAADFMLRLSAVVDQPFVPYKTAVFIDEIQTLQDFDLVTIVKFLVDEGKFRYMFSGSLLGVELYDIHSWPMGYMAYTTMFPLDFEEFLWANHVNQVVIDQARLAFENREPVPDFIHDKLMDMFSKYLLVGGMPDAVNAFVETNDFNRVQLAHETIEQYNRKDIAKYAAADEKLRIKEIYKLLPEELNSKSKRFQLSDIENKKRGDRVEYSFAWLCAAGVAIPVYNSTAAELPLKINKERTLLKLFHEDTGLLTYMLLDANGKRKILNQEKDINFGALYENVCAQLMKAHGFDDQYYFSNKKIGEVDFMVERDGNVLPIEVKSGKSYARHVALDNLLANQQNDIPEAVVFCNKNTAINNKVTYLPIYMVEFLCKRNRYLEKNNVDI